VKSFFDFTSRIEATEPLGAGARHNEKRMACPGATGTGQALNSFFDFIARIEATEPLGTESGEADLSPWLLA
jgi:uncharacterized protein YegL